MTIALCMIVKDEARFLPGCLASVAGLVDEIVVVDTGSTDDTVELAQQAGARVLRHVWDDDFAAARNVAVAHATTDHVLVLDADERITRGGAAQIRAACASGGADGWLLPIANADRIDAPIDAVASGECRAGGVAWQPRVFRRTPDLRWEGRVHETPRRWLQAVGRIVEPLHAPVVHYGYVDEIVEQRNKRARNERLLTLRCAAEPNDPDPLIYLAHSQVEAGNSDAAWPTLMEAWRLVAGADLEQRQRATVLWLVQDVLTVAFRRPDPELGAGRAREAMSWGITHPNVSYLAGLSFERWARSGGAARSDAVAAYRAGVGWRGLATAPLIDGVQAWRLPLRLGIVLCQQDAHREALNWLKHAAAHRPDHPPITVAWAEALVGAGDPASALRLLEPLMASIPSADAWWVAAYAMDRLGDHAGAASVLRRAEGLGIPEEPHRATLVAPLVAS